MLNVDFLGTIVGLAPKQPKFNSKFTLNLKD